MAARDDRTGSGEDRLIATYFAPLARDPGAFGLTDDVAAITPPAGQDLVLTTDALVGGVHFFANDPADKIAQKALRVNLSDLAAKGAKPLGYLLTLALAKEVGEDWLAAFASGLKGDGEHYGCALLGGDSVRTPGPTTVSVTMIGTLPQESTVRRSGAKAGDAVFVSGTIGDAALGVRMRKAEIARLSQAQQAHLRDRYLLPQPRTSLAEAVRTHASAAMDVSDGLAGDFAKLCRASKVAGEINARKVPLSDAAKAALANEPALLEAILSGGDDYEILCTIPPARRDAFKAAAAAARVPVTEIGAIGSGEGIAIRGPDGEALRLTQLSYSHF